MLLWGFSWNHASIIFRARVSVLVFSFLMVSRSISSMLQASARKSISPNINVLILIKSRWVSKWAVDFLEILLRIDMAFDVAFLPMKVSTLLVQGYNFREGLFIKNWDRRKRLQITLVMTNQAKFLLLCRINTLPPVYCNSTFVNNRGNQYVKNSRSTKQAIRCNIRMHDHYKLPPIYWKPKDEKRSLKLSYNN